MNFEELMELYENQKKVLARLQKEKDDLSNELAIMKKDFIEIRKENKELKRQLADKTILSDKSGRKLRLADSLSDKA